MFEDAKIVRSQKIERVTRKPGKEKPSTTKKVQIRSEKTIEQLAKEQGVKPFDPSENGKNWPKGASFKKFIDAIHSGRK